MCDKKCFRDRVFKDIHKFENTEIEYWEIKQN